MMDREDVEFVETLKAVRDRELDSYVESKMQQARAVDQQQVTFMDQSLKITTDYQDNKYKAGGHSQFRPFSANVTSKTKSGLHTVRNAFNDKGPKNQKHQIVVTDNQSMSSLIQKGVRISDTMSMGRRQVEESTKMDSESHQTQGMLMLSPMQVSQAPKFSKSSRLGSAVTAKNSQRSINWKIQ